MREQYNYTAENTLSLQGHKDPLIRKTVLLLIPTFAAYNTSSFCEHYLHKAMSHLQAQAIAAGQLPRTQ